MIQKVIIIFIGYLIFFNNLIAYAELDESQKEFINKENGGVDLMTALKLKKDFVPSNDIFKISSDALSRDMYKDRIYPSMNEQNYQKVSSYSKFLLNKQRIIYGKNYIDMKTMDILAILTD